MHAQSYAVHTGIFRVPPEQQPVPSLEGSSCKCAAAAPLYAPFALRPHLTGAAGQKTLAFEASNHHALSEGA